MESFYCSCVPRSILMLSYLLSAMVMGFLMCMLLMVLSFCYVSFSGNDFLNLSQFLQACGLLLCTFVSSALVALLAQWVNSDHAWGAFSTLQARSSVFWEASIFRRMLPGAVQGVLKSLPFLHETAMMRDIFTASACRIYFIHCLLPFQIPIGKQWESPSPLTIRHFPSTSRFSLCCFVV